MCKALEKNKVAKKQAAAAAEGTTDNQKTTQPTSTTTKVTSTPSSSGLQLHVRIDAKFCAKYAHATHEQRNATIVLHLQFPLTATLQDMKDQIAEHDCQCTVTNYQMITIPHGKSMLRFHPETFADMDIATFLSKPQTTNVMHCLLVPCGPFTTPVPFDVNFNCGSCVPIDLIHPHLVKAKDPNKHDVQLDVPIAVGVLRARIHDDGLAKALRLLSASDLCGLMEVHDRNGAVLETTVTVEGSFLLCRLSALLLCEQKYVVVLRGRRLSTIVIPPCCAKHTPEEHDIENQYLTFQTERQCVSEILNEWNKSPGKAKLEQFMKGGGGSGGQEKEKAAGPAVSLPWWYYVQSEHQRK